MHAHTARNFNLDTLRGIAILLVVLFHLNVPVFRTGGWIGVDLFFVLSGFLIAGLLFREWITTGTLNLPRFYVRRGFKIYPAFYVFLAATLAVNLVAPGISSFPVTVHATLAEATFTQNYFQGIWGQTPGRSLLKSISIFSCRFCYGSCKGGTTTTITHSVSCPLCLWLLQQLNSLCASQQREARQPTRQ